MGVDGNGASTTNPKGMAMATKQDAQWVTIDPTTLSPEQQDTYAKYKALYREMKNAREIFESEMSQDVAAGERMIFGYNFGKLSIAIVPDDRKPAKAKQSTQSLAGYMASRTAAGQSC